MPNSYALTGLHTRSPIRWGGYAAEVWFRGAPGVVDIDEPPTHQGPPIEAAYCVATDPYDWDDAEKIAEALRDHMYQVALAALRGDQRAEEIAGRIIDGWQVITIEDGYPVLRALQERIEDAAADWRYEIGRLRDFASLDAVNREISPLRAELAFGGPQRRYVLIRWRENRPRLPAPLPFLRLSDTERYLHEAAYRLAVAEIIAEGCGYTLTKRGDPCAEALDALTLTAEERRLLMWARDLASPAAAHALGGRVADRARAIMQEIRQRIWPHA